MDSFRYDPLIVNRRDVTKAVTAFRTMVEQEGPTCEACSRRSVSGITAEVRTQDNKAVIFRAASCEVHLMPMSEYLVMAVEWVTKTGSEGFV
jgi:hypothetical protein